METEIGVETIKMIGTEKNKHEWKLKWELQKQTEAEILNRIRSSNLNGAGNQEYE